MDSTEKLSSARCFSSLSPVTSSAMRSHPREPRACRFTVNSAQGNVPADTPRGASGCLHNEVAQAAAVAGQPGRVGQVARYMLRKRFATVSVSLMVHCPTSHLFQMKIQSAARESTVSEKDSPNA
jgi:hypothetical protein